MCRRRYDLTMLIKETCGGGGAALVAFVKFTSVISRQLSHVLLALCAAQGNGGGCARTPACLTACCRPAGSGE
jgi:hypothetical protein